MGVKVRPRVISAINKWAGARSTRVARDSDDTRHARSTEKNSRHYISFVSNPQEALEELEELKKIVPGEALVYFLLSKVGLCSASLNDIRNQ